MNKYTVNFCVDGLVSVNVEANSAEEAEKAANDIVSDADFGPLYDIGWNLSSIDEDAYTDNTGEEDILPQGLESKDVVIDCPESMMVKHIYYNPDSASGGQFVIQEITYEDTHYAYHGSTPFYDYIDSVAKTYLVDKGTKEFSQCLKMLKVRNFKSDVEWDMETLYKHADRALRAEQEAKN